MRHTTKSNNLQNTSNLNTKTNELYDLASEANIPIENVKLPEVEAMSLMDQEGNCFIGIDLSQTESDSEELIKLGHELGHCLTGSFYNRYSKLNDVQKQEATANRWLMEFLVSADDLHDAVSNGYCTMWELAEYFDLPQELMQKIVYYYEERD